MEIINEATEKFRGFQSGLCGFLFDMLRELNVLEREFISRDISIHEKIPELNRVQIAEEFEAMWNDLHDRYEQIVSGRCSEKLLSKGYGQSFSSYVTYGWADEDFEGCTAVFQMTVPKKAVIEVRYKRGTQECADRFTLIKSGENWLVDAHNWWTDYDSVWHRGHI